MDMDFNSLLSQEEIVKVSKKAGLNFKNILSPDEIDNCILTATWRALSKYDTNQKSCKFSTYLYSGVEMECKSMIRFNKKSIFNKKKGNLKNNKSNYINHEQDVDMRDEISNCPDSSIIYDRFYKNMTIKEIAKNNKISTETVRKKINKNIEIMRHNIL